MAHAVSELSETARRSTAVQKSEGNLCDGDWKWVKHHTLIKGPFAKDKKHSTQHSVFRTMFCPECAEILEIEPTKTELKEMSEEAKERLLKALQHLYGTYFEKGMITRRTEQLLTAATNDALDTTGAYVYAHHVKTKYMDVPEFVERTMNKLRLWNSKIKVEDVSEETIYLAGQTVGATEFRKFCILFYMKPYFQPIIFAVNVLSIAPLTLSCLDLKGKHFVVYDIVFACIIALVYVSEAIVKITALGFERYYRVNWSKFAILVTVHGVLCVATYLIFFFLKIDEYFWIELSRVFVLIRVIEMYRLTLKLFAKVLQILESLTAAKLYNAYDVGYGYVTSQEEVTKHTSFLKEYKESGTKLLSLAEENIFEMTQELNYIQANYPSVPVALKSHKVALLVLHDVLKVLNGLRKAGVIEEMPCHEIKEEIELMQRNISLSPKTLSTDYRAEDILAEVEWIPNDTLLSSLLSTYTVRDYITGDIIHNTGQKPSGISVITSGVVKVSGNIAKVKKGILPNTDSLTYFQSTGSFVDFVSFGHCLGLMGFLIDEKFATTAVCQNAVRVIHLSHEVLNQAEESMGQNSPLSYSIWRTVALKIAQPMINEHPDFQDYETDYMKVLLENAIMPNLSSSMSFFVDPMVRVVILIQGQARDPIAGVIYMGPVVLPPTVQKLSFDEEPDRRSRIIMLIVADPGYKIDERLEWQILESTAADENQESLCLFHTIRHRRLTMGPLFKDDVSRVITQRKSMRSSTLPLMEEETFH